MPLSDYILSLQTKAILQCAGNIIVIFPSNQIIGLIQELVLTFS